MMVLAGFTANRIREANPEPHLQAIRVENQLSFSDMSHFYAKILYAFVQGLDREADIYYTIWKKRKLKFAK